MTRCCQILLHVVELLCIDDGEGVFLTIDRLGFQRGEQLIDRHGNGICPHAVEHVDIHVVLHGAHLESGEVFDLAHRAAAVGEVAEAVFPVGQSDQITLLELGQNLLSKRAVEHRIGVFFVVKGKRQAEDAEFLDQIGQGGGRWRSEFLRATAQRRLHLLIATELGCRIDGDLDPSIALLVNNIGELAGSQGLWMAFRIRSAEFGLDFLGGGGTQTESGGKYDQRGTQRQFFHANLPKRGWLRLFIKINAARINRLRYHKTTPGVVQDPVAGSIS